MGENVKVNSRIHINVENLNVVTPLIVASGISERAVLKLLLRGADVQMTGSNGGTALHHTVSNQWEESHLVCEILLNCDADALATDRFGFTPLHCAGEFNATCEVAEMLLSHGA